MQTLEYINRFQQFHNLAYLCDLLPPGVAVFKI